MRSPTKHLAGVIRIILGMAVIGMAVYVYRANGPQMASDRPVEIEILGNQVETTTRHVAIGIIACGAVGALIIAIGIATILRKAPAAKTLDPDDQ